MPNQFTLESERLNRHGEVRVLMANRDWMPGVSDEILKQYADPRPATPENWEIASRDVMRRGRPPEAKRDHLIPRVLEMRKERIPWHRIAAELRICASSVRRLYTKGLAQRGMADFQWR